MQGRLKGALIIKRVDYMAVMGSAIWAQGWRSAEDPVLSGPLMQSLQDFILVVNLNQGRGFP